MQIAQKLESKIRQEKLRIEKRLAHLHELHDLYLRHACPLKNGQRIQLETGLGVETGEVHVVRYREAHWFGLNLTPDDPCGWSAVGSILKKGKSEATQPSFTLSSFEHALVDGVWRKVAKFDSSS